MAAISGILGGIAVIGSLFSAFVEEYTTDDYDSDSNSYDDYDS